MTKLDLLKFYNLKGDDMRRVYFIVVFLSIIGSLYIYKSLRNSKANVNVSLEENAAPVFKTEDNTVPYEPRVYIYNTHQQETYADIGVGFSPTVLDASHTLRDYLEELNIQTYVEDNDFYDFLALNNWDYNSLYKVSRFYLEDTMKRYKSVKLYIDLHRDSIKHELSTTTFDDKDYAKILFVVGISNENYKENLKTAKNLNSLITSKYNISRGILQKSAVNANGIYNQDLNANIVLIEVGGYQNKYSEVDNTLKILAMSIKEYLNG